MYKNPHFYAKLLIFTLQKGRLSFEDTKKWFGFLESAHYKYLKKLGEVFFSNFDPPLLMGFEPGPPAWKPEILVTRGGSNLGFLLKNMILPTFPYSFNVLIPKIQTNFWYLQNSGSLFLFFLGEVKNNNFGYKWGLINEIQTKRISVLVL